MKKKERWGKNWETVHARKSTISILLSLLLIITFLSAGLAFPPGFRDRETILHDFFNLMNQYPTLMTYESIGKSYEGRDIPMFKIGNPNGGKVLFTMASHGDEIDGPEVGYYMAKWILERREPEIANRILQHNLVMIVIENIDSYMMKRKNMHLYGYVQGANPNLYGVDLNRNMPTGWGGSDSSNNVTDMHYRGPYPASELESQALIRVFETYKPKFHLDYHAGGGFVFAKPSGYAKMSSSTSQYHDVIANKIRTLAKSRGVAVFGYGQLGISGCVADQAYVSANSTSYLLEDGTSTPTYDQIESIYMPRILPFIIVFAQESGVDKMAGLFEDGLETADFRNFTKTIFQNGSCDIVTPGFKGNYAARFVTSPTLQFAWAQACVTVNNDDLYVRGYFYVEQGAAAMQTSDRFYFLKLMALDNGQTAVVGIRREYDQTIRWVLWYREEKMPNGTFNGTHTYGTTIFDTTPRWICVEAHYSKPAQLYEVWVDGKLEIRMSGVDTSQHPNVTEVQFGVYKSGTVGQPYDPTGQYVIEVLGDEMVIATEYIGPGEQYTLAVLEDGFESGSFSAWNGTRTTSGENATVVNNIYYHGNHSAMFASNGTGWFEGAYCYVAVPSSSELYARGYFMVNFSGITDDNDRFYFIIFRAGTEGVAYAGWRRVGGVVRWSLIIRDGTGWATAYSDWSPSLDQWYSVELHWVRDSSNGCGELNVNGILVCSIQGMNTAAFGDVNFVRFGLAEVYNCGSTVTYCDCVKIAGTYIGPEPPLTIFEDGFESGNFSAWTGTRVTSGETATVVDTLSYHGNYSAMFTSNGNGGFEGAYGYVAVPSSSELYARGYFYVSQSGIVNNDDRFYFIRFLAGDNNVAYAGWRRVEGVIRWNLIIRDGTDWVTAYSSSSPSLNKWYCLELLWFKDSKNGHAELYVDGVLLCSIKDKDTTTLGDINQVRFGLAELYNCRNTAIYCDSCKIFKVTPEFFPPWDLNQNGKVDIEDLGNCR